MGCSACVLDQSVHKILHSLIIVLTVCYIVNLESMGGGGEANPTDS